jgi:hypothetical protein
VANGSLVSVSVSTAAGAHRRQSLQTGRPGSPASAECLRIARPARGVPSAWAVPKPHPPLPPFPVTCRRPSPTMQRDLCLIRLCKPAPPQRPAKRLPAVMVACVDLSRHGAVPPDDPDRCRGRSARRGPCCRSGREPGCQGQRHGAQRRRRRAGLHQHARGARPLSPAPSRQPGECPTDRLRSRSPRIRSARRSAALVASANTPRPAIDPHDPAIAAARNLGRTPSAELGSLAAYYSGCTLETKSVPAASQARSCLLPGGLVHPSLRPHADRRRHPVHELHPR